MDEKAPLVLALDTGTACTTVALTRGTMSHGEILATASLVGKITHSRRLISLVDWIMQQARVDWSMVDAIGVGLGPGSFTGLRIGMATAKGLAAASGRPLVGVSTLDVLAAACESSRMICAVLDARKKEVYCGFYWQQEGRVERMGEIEVLPPEELARCIDTPTLMVGDGVVTYQELWRDLLGDLIRFGTPASRLPSAAVLGLFGGERLVAGDTLEIGAAVPLYVRKSDAQLSLVTRKHHTKKQ